MEIQRNAEIRAELLSNRRHPPDHTVHKGASVEVVELGSRIHLDRGEPLVHPLLDMRKDLLWPVAADPRIGADLVPYRAAEQLVHRHAELASFDIPQRGLDCCRRGAKNRTAPVERAAMHAQPEI